MASSTTSTLSPLVAGAADLARKLAAYKATSNSQQQGVQEGDDRTYQEIPSPLDVSFGPQHTATNFSTLPFHAFNCRKQKLLQYGTQNSIIC